MSLANTLKRFYSVVFRRDVLGPLSISKKRERLAAFLPASEDFFPYFVLPVASLD